VRRGREGLEKKKGDERRRKEKGWKTTRKHGIIPRSVQKY